MTVICWVCYLSTAFCSLIILVSISVFLMDFLRSSLISVVSLLLLLWYWLSDGVDWLIICAQFRLPKVLVLMCLVFIACFVFGIVSDFVLSCWTCMLVNVLFCRGGNSLRCNCFLASAFIAGWVFSVAVIASNFLYFSRGWAVYC